MELAPEFAERVRAAQRESKFIGTAELPGYFRKPFGPGWALVGDAGYHKNPITTMGINDAFRDAQLLAAALDDAFTGRRSYEDGMAAYQQTRDRDTRPIYAFTDDFARLEPPSPDLQQLLGAMHGNQEAMDGFVSVQAGTLPAPEFFAPGERRPDHGAGRSRSLTAPAVATDPAPTALRPSQPVVYTPVGSAW